jgi:hypothetical protein
MLSQTQEVMQRSEGVGKEKRKPVRRDPERRRQQNVQAQKKYRKCRSSLGIIGMSTTYELWAQEPLENQILIIHLGEKLRERLDRLKALAASAAQSRGIETAPAAATGPSEAVNTLTHITTKSLPASDALDVSVFGPSGATLSECQHLSLESDNTPSALSSWESTIQIDPSLLIRNKHDNGLGPYWTTNVDFCGCSSPHIQIRTLAPDPFRYGEVRTLNFGPSATAPDPYANNLRIDTICSIAALHTLGIYVGITEEMLCSEKSLSPFFRSGAESADDMVKSNIISMVQRVFETLKPDLRPSREQISVKHHPYIDILPFPTLRKNLITHQEEIDEDEFFQDVLTGLVCWGSAGIGKRDRQVSTGYASTGTPWDVRSWEARVWFLKKYWTLLGGEDGELVRQSEWWRSMRGDDCVEEH